MPHCQPWGTTPVADLDRVMTVEKGWLSLAGYVQGWTADSEIRKFQATVARRYERFAFPDDFTRVAAKLRDKIVSRHGKLTSPEGQLFSTVSQVRVRADPHWSSSDVEVTLSFILPADTLGEVPEDSDGSPSLNETLRWLSAKQRSSTDLAERILSEADPGTRDVLWTRMAEAWARTCKPFGCIRGVYGEVRDAGEYPISEYWESSPLDVDYLSDDGSTASDSVKDQTPSVRQDRDEDPEVPPHSSHFHPRFSLSDFWLILGATSARIVKPSCSREKPHFGHASCYGCRSELDHGLSFTRLVRIPNTDDIGTLSSFYAGKRVIN